MMHIEIIEYEVKLRVWYMTSPHKLCNRVIGI
jgi:hypothetical protein